MSELRGPLLSPRQEGGKPRTRIDDDSGIETEYQLGEVLGRGAFGVVWEATRRSDGQKYAIKMVPKDKPGSIAIQLLEREIQVLNRVNHNHIVNMIEVYETPKKVFMVLELCQGGELSDLLKEKRCFKEEDVKIIMRGLAEAVVYMHDKDMVHRDLKLENILLSIKDPNNKFNIKVTDFGLSHMKGLPGCDDLMSSRCGTLYYMAPEVLTNKHEYSKLCDVWSMGVIMYALLCGGMPFKADNAAQLEEHILSGELKFSEPEWITISDGAKELIKGMLNVNTIHRLTARQVLEDSWITGDTTRKRMDPLMMLMEDSPSPPRPHADTTTLPTKSSTSITNLKPSSNSTFQQPKNVSRSTSASKVGTFSSQKGGVGGGVGLSPQRRRTVASVSTGRLQLAGPTTNRTVPPHRSGSRKSSSAKHHQ